MTDDATPVTARREDCWTKAPPERDGYYWWRAGLAYRAEVRLVRNGVVLFRFLSAAVHDLPESVGGEWFGPLQEPGGDAVENCHEP